DEAPRSRPRSLSLLFCGRAGFAFVLSIIGIYGVMSYYVEQHSREIGIRLALGGSRGNLFRLVVGQGMIVAAGGVAIGMVAAFASARAASRLLFGVSAGNPPTFLTVGGILTAVALVGWRRPAAPAMGVQPASVLRDD